MTITFVGHGYVGLVTAAVFSDLGNKVWVIGHTPEKIENLNKGIIPIYEPGLEDVVKRNVDAGRLVFTLDYAPAVSESDVVFIAVGTPPKENGEADLSVVYDVARKVGENLDGYSVVITKSTVPVGTSEKVRRIMQEVKAETANFDYASVPEFLREGQALKDTFFPDRVVIGTDAKRAEDMLISLHEPIIKNGSVETQTVLTNIPTAEMIKYAANSFLAMKISFANAIAQLSELMGADGPKVMHGIGLDKRIGSSFLNAGAGYGGSCFPKDVRALIAIAKNYNYDFTLLQEVEQINKDAMQNVVHKAKKLFNNEIHGKHITMLGLTFKPDTDDMRDAPSLVIIDALLREGAKITAYDPIGMHGAKKILKDKDVDFADNPYEAAKDSDLVILVTEWNEFKELDLRQLKETMKQPQIIDGRNIYDPDTMRNLGFTYIGMGR